MVQHVYFILTRIILHLVGSETSLWRGLSVRWSLGWMVWSVMDSLVCREVTLPCSYLFLYVYVYWRTLSFEALWTLRRRMMFGCEPNSFKKTISLETFQILGWKICLNISYCLFECFSFKYVYVYNIHIWHLISNVKKC